MLKKFAIVVNQINRVLVLIAFFLLTVACFFAFDRLRSLWPGIAFGIFMTLLTVVSRDVYNKYVAYDESDENSI